MDNLGYLFAVKRIRLGRDFCVRVFPRPAKPLPEKGSRPAQGNSRKGFGQ